MVQDSARRCGRHQCLLTVGAGALAAVSLTVLLWNVLYHDALPAYEHCVSIGATSEETVVHVYRWPQHERLPVELVGSERLSGSLFSNNPRRESVVGELLLFAGSLVPSHDHYLSPLAVWVTSDVLEVFDSVPSELEQLRARLSHTPFAVPGHWITVVEPGVQAAWGWLAWGSDAWEPLKRNQVVLGLDGTGFSVAAPVDTASPPPPPPWHTSVLIGTPADGAPQSLYAWTYALFGANSAAHRLSVLLAAEAPATTPCTNYSNPCLPRGLYVEGEGGCGAVGSGVDDACHALLAQHTLNKTRACPFAPCAFNGQYQPASLVSGAQNEHWVILGSVLPTMLTQLNLTSFARPRDVPPGPWRTQQVNGTTPFELRSAVAPFCNMSVREFDAYFGHGAPYGLCGAAMWTYALLVDGMGLSETQPLTTLIQPSVTGPAGFQWLAGATRELALRYTPPDTVAWTHAMWGGIAYDTILIFSACGLSLGVVALLWLFHSWRVRYAKEQGEAISLIPRHIRKESYVVTA